uniref:NADH dehydrogenase subunit 6 n=1 Tax=Porotermes planiceps TaxID=137007 RepID=UPI002551CBB9|nr:NADH dehydrogenase subunit 6 [Porotermes planiceps]UYX57306.1 NADH dehydrogenase subunit 6 [Porotermes planiceps]WHM51963.1 NADH dehydrogenase subunit 6 [Porotermes planiceps]
MTKMMITTSMLSSMMFTQMKHPLAMGLMLLLQTTLMSTISGLLHQSFWYSYILFLIFLGGMLVLFIYVTSLASNEMFSMSTKMLPIMASTMMTLTLMNMWIKNDSEESTKHEMIMNNTTNNILEKLYNEPTGKLTIMLALYLFLALIVVAKVTNISKGPLRQMKT